MPISRLWFAVHKFKIILFIGITWKSIPNFTEIGEEIQKAGIENYL
jgi:hypothetical protein